MEISARRSFLLVCTTVSNIDKFSLNVQVRTFANQCKSHGLRRNTLRFYPSLRGLILYRNNRLFRETLIYIKLLYRRDLLKLHDFNVPDQLACLFPVTITAIKIASIANLFSSICTHTHTHARARGSILL